MLNLNLSKVAYSGLSEISAVCYRFEPNLRGTRLLS